MKPMERLAQLRALSGKGLPKADAAARVSMTVAGVDTLLYRLEGTTKWPIAR
ncbi:hypothetical protein [Sphingomonas sp. T9W2]|uniref:hypothetical protein n=1 Tax=Sphingomonas sp. T9W2 TaxID=3143183 RepID=UPI0031F5937D